MNKWKAVYDMRRAVMAITFSALLGAGASYAAPPSVYGLLEDCRAREGSIERSYCLLYLAGFMDGFMAGGGGNREICLPRGATIASVRQAFIRWAVGHPQYAGWRPGKGMRESLRASYPCYTPPPTYSD